jgi:hypothetical protein
VSTLDSFCTSSSGTREKEGDGGSHIPKGEKRNLEGGRRGEPSEALPYLLGAFSDLPSEPMRESPCFPDEEDEAEKGAGRRISPSSHDSSQLQNGTD